MRELEVGRKGTRRSSASATICVCVVVALIGATLPGCLRSTQRLDGRDGFALAENNSSQGSSDGSDGSSEGTNTSNDSSDDSKGSSDNKSTENASEDSSRDSSDDSSGGNSLLISSVGTLVVLGVLAIYLIAAAPTRKKTAMLEDMQRFLKEHRRTVRIALSRGSGPIAADLAAVLGVSGNDAEAIGLALWSHRDTLDAFLTDADITPEEAEGFAAALVRALEQQEALREPMLALRARVEATWPAEQAPRLQPEQGGVDSRESEALR